jgi:hypothetical protein
MRSTRKPCVERLPHGGERPQARAALPLQLVLGMSLLEPLPTRARTLVRADGTTRVRRFVRCPTDRTWASVEECKRCSASAPPSALASSEPDAAVVCTRSHPSPRDLPIQTACHTSVADAVDATLVCVEAGARAGAIGDALRASDTDVAVVVDAGENPIGVLSRKDLERADADTRASDMMTPFVVSLMENVSMTDALTLVVSREIHHLPILASGRVTGMLSRRGIAAWLVRASRPVVPERSLGSESAPVVPHALFVSPGKSLG